MKPANRQQWVAANGRTQQGSTSCPSAPAVARAPPLPPSRARWLAGAKGVGDAAAVGDLLGKHAEWSEATKDFGAAADMFIRARRWERALALITKHGLWDRAPSLVHAMGRDTDAGPLAKAAAALAAAGQYAAAKEALLRLGDTGALVDLAVAHQRWDEAELFAAGEPGLAARAALPRARCLVAQGRCEWVRVRVGGRAAADHPPTAEHIP